MKRVNFVAQVIMSGSSPLCLKSVSPLQWWFGAEASGILIIERRPNLERLVYKWLRTRADRDGQAFYDEFNYKDAQIEMVLDVSGKPVQITLKPTKVEPTCELLMQLVNGQGGLEYDDAMLHYTSKVMIGNVPHRIIIEQLSL